MTPTAEQLLTAALDLGEADRLELIEALIVSFQPSDPRPLDDSWQEVVRTRSAEVDSGAVTLIPWEEVKRRAREAAGG